MKKKTGFNIMLFVLIFNFIFILSCSRAFKNPSVGILLQTDREFSEMSVRDGMFRAFLNYIADDGVILRDEEYPSKGKKLLLERYTGKSDTSFVLSWDPLYEKISVGEDLGYTYGIYSSLDKATGKTEKGTYVTVWAKQSDGSWKFVLDAGTEGLPDNGTLTQLFIPGKGCKNSKD